MAFEAHSRVVLKGPLFTGEAKRELDRFETELREAVADDGVAQVIKLAGGHFQYKNSRPTGHYVRNVTHQRRVDSNRIHVDDVIYGNWIEGTSSRNDRTRFKGYNLFRKATQELDGRVKPIANDVIKPFLRRMN